MEGEWLVDGQGAQTMALRKAREAFIRDEVTQEMLAATNSGKTGPGLTGPVKNSDATDQPIDPCLAMRCRSMRFC